MTQSYQQPQAALAGFLDSMHQDSSMSAYSLFGQYPESVAFWHDPTATVPPIGLAAPSYPPKQSAHLQPTGDQKKHKRTRSGCFTCRARRIKCDEARPVCERCRKGNRDCVYPSPTASTSKGSRSSAKSRGTRPLSQGSESSSKHDTEEMNPLEPILDEEEPEGTDMGSEASPRSGSGAGHPRQQLHRTQSGHSLRKRSVKQLSEAGSSQVEAGSSPSTESSRYESMSVRSGSFSHSILDLINNSRLAEDVRFYLDFHQQHLSYDHFFLRSTSAHFIHHSILELALGYDPLLYALVGFAAYHHTLQSGGKLYTFLKYYNKALVLLRKSLEAGEDHTEATLCTVLVLTTFEEYIGDWANLVDHHQAAHALMRELLTPDSSNMIDLHTNIFLWYARFDVVAGILAGTETILSRDWYIAKEQYDAQQAALYPDDPNKQLAYVASINRRFGLEMASLYAKLSRGLIPLDDFVVQNEQLGLTMERAKAILHQYEDSEEKVRSYPEPLPLTDDDVVDPYEPGCIWQGSLWEANFFKIDLLSTELMFKYQSMLSLKLPLLPELQSLALQQCQLIETISRYPQRGNGYFMNFKNSIGISSMFLPKDGKFQMWSRRKMAVMEQNGYIIAPKFRAVLAAIWQLPEVNHWWLPHDEGFTDIIRAVRTLSEEKKDEPLDGFRENVRDMKSLFWKLSVDDPEDEQSPSSSHHSHT